MWEIIRSISSVRHTLFSLDRELSEVLEEVKFGWLFSDITELIVEWNAGAWMYGGTWLNETKYIIKNKVCGSLNVSIQWILDIQNQVLPSKFVAIRGLSYNEYDLATKSRKCVDCYFVVILRISTTYFSCFVFRTDSVPELLIYPLSNHSHGLPLRLSGGFKPSQDHVSFLETETLPRCLVLVCPRKGPECFLLKGVETD